MADANRISNDEGGDPTDDIRQQNKGGTTGAEMARDQGDRNIGADRSSGEPGGNPPGIGNQGAGSASDRSAMPDQPIRPAGDFDQDSEMRDDDDGQSERNRGRVSPDDYPDANPGQGSLGSERAPDE